MSRRLPQPIRVPLICAVLVVSTVVHASVLLLVTLVRALAPRRHGTVLGRLAARIAEAWIAFNSRMLDRCTRVRWTLHEQAVLDPEHSYLVLCNHQSWVDIPVLQYLFNRRIPLLRFFLKRELIWVPVLGAAWWALDFPFMHRYTRDQIARRPELAGRDADATRRACERFRSLPVSIMNFVEGTRFEPGKHAAQESPYRHLLRPRAGGVALVLDAMGGVLHAILDVSIVYPHGKPRLIDLLADRVPEIRIHLRQREIPSALVGADYEGDPEARERFQNWLNQVWQEKDAVITDLLEGAVD